MRPAGLRAKAALTQEIAPTDCISEVEVWTPNMGPQARGILGTHRIQMEYIVGIW